MANTQLHWAAFICFPTFSLITVVLTLKEQMLYQVFRFKFPFWCPCVWADSRVNPHYPPCFSLEGFWPQTPPSWGRRTSLGTCSLCRGSPLWMCPDYSRWLIAEATVTGPPRAACWSNRQVRWWCNIQKLFHLSDWTTQDCRILLGNDLGRDDCNFIKASCKINKTEKRSCCMRLNIWDQLSSESFSLIFSFESLKLQFKIVPNAFFPSIIKQLQRQIWSLSVNGFKRCFCLSFCFFIWCCGHHKATATEPQLYCLS